MLHGNLSKRGLVLRILFCSVLLQARGVCIGRYEICFVFYDYVNSLWHVQLKMSTNLLLGDGFQVWRAYKL